jgi:FAD-dependent oxidoreductase family protein
MSGTPSIVDSRPVVRHDVDLLVVGAGAAGVAAATVAARCRLKVALIERYGFCGGGAVAGLSGTICGIYRASAEPREPGVPLVRGFLDEFVALMESREGLTKPVRYGQTYTRVHDPLVWREVADKLLSDAGVELHLHTVVTDVLLEGHERVAGVMAYTKGGRAEFRATLTIDASGDADLIAMAGWAFTEGRDGQVQNPTMMFRILGVDVDRFLAAYTADTIMPVSVTREIREAHSAGTHFLPRAKIFLFPTPRPGELLCNATRVIGRDGRELNPTRARDLTEAEIEGRRQVREYARFIRERIEGCAGSWVNDTGAQVGVRQTRSLVGIERLTNEDVVSGRKRPDGIARSAWPIEVHTGEKPQIRWLLNDYYEIPYGAFVPAHGESLLVAGRCLAAEHEAMASARVTAQCFAYGEAIARAAELTIRERKAPRALRGEDIRTLLKQSGADL